MNENPTPPILETPSPLESQSATMLESNNEVVSQITPKTISQSEKSISSNSSQPKSSTNKSTSLSSKSVISAQSNIDRGRVQSAIEAAHKQAIAARIQREFLTWRRCCTASITFGIMSSVLAILSLTPSWFTFKTYTLYLYSPPVPLVGTFSLEGIYPVALVGIVLDILATLIPIYLRIRIYCGYYKPPITHQEVNEEELEEQEKFVLSSLFFTKISISLRLLSLIMTIFVVSAMEARYRTGWTTKQEGWVRMVASICVSFLSLVCLLPMISKSLYTPDMSLLPDNVLLKQDEENHLKTTSRTVSSTATSSMEESYTDMSKDNFNNISSVVSLSPSTMRRPDHLSIHQHNHRSSTAEQQIPPPTLILPVDSHRNFTEENGKYSNDSDISPPPIPPPPPPPPPSLSPLSQSYLPITPPSSPLRSASSPRSIPLFNRTRESGTGSTTSLAASPSASSPLSRRTRGGDDLILSPRSSIQVTFSRISERESP
jgi:hypothetical protein